MHQSCPRIRDQSHATAWIGPSPSYPRWRQLKVTAVWFKFTCLPTFTNYLKLHPLLSWSAYPKPFRKPAHSLKRMTSTGRSRHIGSSRSVWWILVTRYLPKLPKLVKAHSALSAMHDPWRPISSSESLTENLHDVVALLDKLIWYVTGCWQLQWRSI